MKDFFKISLQKHKNAKKWKLFSKNREFCASYIKYFKYLSVRFSSVCLSRITNSAKPTNCLINGNKIKSFVEKKGLKFHHFEGLDVVDYGGVLEVIV